MTDALKQAAQQALEALEEVEAPKRWPFAVKQDTRKAIESLRAALAEPQPAVPQSDPCAPPEVQEAIERGEFEPGHWTVRAQHAIEKNPNGALRIIARLRDEVASLKAAPQPAAPVICESCKAIGAAYKIGKEAAPDTDVRKILLAVVPGDGDGYEVYANTVADVERKLTELGQRIEELEGAPAPAQAVNPLDALLTRILNRRVTVEQQLFDMAAGKLPMPDKDKLRELARYLGDPTAPGITAPTANG